MAPLLLVLLLPLSALADGMVVPSIAVPAKVTIPDQRALIHFTNGTERLVIETRFTGEGTNFAWVLPLPAQPVIEPATSGVFPTLQYLFRPQITHRVPHYYIWILVLTAAGLLLRYGRITAIVIAFLLGILFAALLLPSLGRSKSASITTDWRDEVKVLDRKIVGVFETATIASQDPQALQIWLRVNGYALPVRTDPVLTSYIKDGWVFVAAKIHRDKAERETSTPQPLSFTFATAKPVYPMRLTGVDNESLSVELYVFGPDRARAPHFKAERCVQPRYPEIPPRTSWNWSRRIPTTPAIVHPLLRQWLNGAPVATKLTATLSQANMRQDVWIDWTPYSEKKKQLYSPSAAATLTLNWAAAILAAGLLGAGLMSATWTGDMTKRPPFGSIAILAAITAGAMIYLALPKTEVRVIRAWAGYPEEVTLMNLYWWLEGETNASPETIRAEIQRFLTDPVTRANWNRYASPSIETTDNHLLGGPIHEEDSPGNYTLHVRESDRHLELLGYGVDGAEYLVGEWPARN